MKIALIGYGKMGKMIEKTALDRGHKITAIVEPKLAEQASIIGTELYKNFDDANNLNNADVAVEFTTPGTVMENIRTITKMKIPLVVGTTGWYDNLDEVKRTVEESESKLIWSSNYSMGVNLFFRIVWYAAKLLDSFPEYDIGGLEAHHNSKMDSPSGTARILVDGVLSRTNRKKKAVWETLNRKPEPDELHFPSLRMGSLPGIHSLFFDSSADTIEITHTARSRESLALGAIRAAEWISGSKIPNGIYDIDQMLMNMLNI